MAQERRQHGGRRRTVDVVVAEDRDHLAPLDRVGDARGCLRHVGQHLRVRHQPAHRRIEEFDDAVRLDVAPGEHARQQLGHAMPLRDRERPRCAALVEAVTPGPAAHRMPHVEEEPAHWPNVVCGRASVCAANRGFQLPAPQRLLARRHRGGVRRLVVFGLGARDMLVEDIDQGLRGAGAYFPDRPGRVAAACEFLLVLERCRVGDDGRGLARLAEQEIERSTVEALQAVRRLMLDPLQRRDMRADRSLRVAGEPPAARGVRVLNQKTLTTY